MPIPPKPWPTFAPLGPQTGRPTSPICPDGASESRGRPAPPAPQGTNSTCITQALPYLCEDVTGVLGPAPCMPQVALVANAPDAVFAYLRAGCPSEPSEPLVMTQGPVLLTVVGGLAVAHGSMGALLLVEAGAPFVFSSTA